MAACGERGRDYVACNMFTYVTGTNDLIFFFLIIHFMLCLEVTDSRSQYSEAVCYLGEG